MNAAIVALVGSFCLAALLSCSLGYWLGGVIGRNHTIDKEMRNIDEEIKELLNER